MKFFKLTLVALILLVNLAIASPSWADSDLTKGTDYAEVTQALDELIKAKDAPDRAGYTSEQYQQRLNDLEFQKYVLETAEDPAQCRNETGKTLAIYATKKSGAASLYFLGDGKVTDDDWSCKGVYLPSGTKVAVAPLAPVQELAEAIALKIVDGTQLVAKTNPQTGAIEFNVRPAKVFKAGETDWSIPVLSQADIDAKTPNAPID
ncbi:hypothetical protein [Chroococcidiopsis sp.]|uniref:hypothetical protein n=1 Tax=Chroococcidiopsis sp. TaxID=3088168 RepID=UPI000B688867|nr:hypothetical protein B7486_26565 [cyanobacterium TDX16]